MTIHYLPEYAALEGVVGVDDAEALTQWLLQQPVAVVHLGKCEHMHGAVLQVLLALRPDVAEPPADPLLAAALSFA